MLSVLYLVLNPKNKCHYLLSLQQLCYHYILYHKKTLVHGRFLYQDDRD